MTDCPWCKKPIQFWQKKMDYLTSFDTETGKETTEKMHYDCGFSRKGKECFGDNITKLHYRLSQIGMDFKEETK